MWQHNAMAITSTITMWLLFTTVSIKIAGHTNTCTPKVLKILKVNIFLRPGEAMLLPGVSLTSTRKLFYSREKYELCTAYTLTG